MTKFNQTISKYRWTICALLFFATTINYLDRQVLSLLKDRLEVEFNWTDSDYANIVSVFQFIYAISMLFAGRFIDWLGTKKGYAWSIIVWSIGAMVHALSRGTAGFMVSRGVLGFGEAGNFPAAIKTVAEWFPKKERSFATGIFNSGANVGAILAPITVPLMAEAWGWQTAFIIVGAIGFIWLIFWFMYYGSPKEMLAKGKMNQAEFDHIHSDKDEQAIEKLADEKITEEKSITNTQTSEFVSKDNVQATSSDGDRLSALSFKKSPWYVQWGKLLGYKQTWSFALGKFLTDGVWWFFLFWLPAYLKAQYHMTGTEIMFPLAVLYSMTMIGSIGGGWFPAYFMKKGMDAYKARMAAMFVIALFPLVVFSAQSLGTISYWFPVIIIGIAASAHQAWSANIFTIVSDMFPKKSVGSVTGIGGMMGGLGGIVITKVGGAIFDTFRATGLTDFWNSTIGQSGIAQEVLNFNITNKHGEIIDIAHKKELLDLPAEIVNNIQASLHIAPEQWSSLVEAQKTIVQTEMHSAYAYMFAFCAIAYLLAWTLMKLLVPKFKLITDL